MRTVKKFSFRRISRNISSTSGCHVSHTAIHYWCKAYEQKGSPYVFTQIRPGHATGRVVQDEHLGLIERAMQDNPETSSADLQQSIRDQTGTNVSSSTLRRHRANLGWTYKRTRYCQLIRDVNKQKRLEWCRQQLANNETFDNVLFSDEASFEIQRSATKMYYKKGQRTVLRPKPKHPVKVNVLWLYFVNNKYNYFQYTRSL